jgi:hypothetical protein
MSRATADPDIELAFVVLSATLSDAQLAARLGDPDEARGAKQLKHRRFSVWQLSERAHGSSAIAETMARLIGRALERSEMLDDLRREPGAVSQVNVWLWAEVDQEGCGFTVTPEFAADLARLGASLQVRVWGWDEDSRSP